MVLIYEQNLNNYIASDITSDMKRAKITQKTEMKNYSGRLPESLDPDKVVMTKKDVLEIIDLILEQWNKNFGTNWKFIIGLRAIKTGIILQPESVVTKIWSALLGFINQIIYEFTIRDAVKQDEAWAKSLKKVKERIKAEGLEL